MRIRAVPFEDVSALTDAMVVEMTRRYGGEGASPASAVDFMPPVGVFLVAEVGGIEVACGGLRFLGEGVGEVKRMYVDPAHRGKGVARGVLRALLQHARDQHLKEVWLETGVEQPEAMALYASEGFIAISPYGHYRDEPRSRCYALPLTAANTPTQEPRPTQTARE